MDGQLTFYEREALTFSRFLPQFLLPGPLCYNPAVDCFITCSSAFEVQCYKYQSLVAAQAAAEKETGQHYVLLSLPYVQVQRCLPLLLPVCKNMFVAQAQPQQVQEHRAGSCIQNGSGHLVRWLGTYNLANLQVELQHASSCFTVHVHFAPTLCPPASKQ